MANTGSQVEAIKTLLMELLEAYDPSTSAAEGSLLYTKVVLPLAAALGTDVFDTNAEKFILDRLHQEYPNLPAADGDAVTDLLVRPHQLLVEALKRENQIVRRGQSVKNVKTMRSEDAQSLAANWFVRQKTGRRGSTTQRVFFAQPTFVDIRPSTVFSTTSGLKFYATSSMVIRAEQVLLQKIGNEYYVDVPVLAEKEGEEYNVAMGEITVVSGINGARRTSNLSDVEDGYASETAEELLTRVESSLTERSLNTRRGISARIMTDYPAVRNIEVVGYGDPEMQRDVITGGGNGRVLSSGVCFVVGQFVLMFSTFEDRGLSGTDKVAAGDEIDFNYWKFLYDVDPEDAHETFTIEDILFDTRDAAENWPTILLFRISGNPTPSAPIAGILPGVLPGVFCVVRTTGSITISDIPGGITEPDTIRGEVEVEDGEIHIGGHYDVWVRPSSDTRAEANLQGVSSESAVLERDDLTAVSGSHQVHAGYTLSVSSGVGTVSVGSLLTGQTSGATGVVYEKRVGSTGIIELDLAELTGEFSELELVETEDSSTFLVTAISKTDLEEEGVLAGMALTIVTGPDEGTYRICQVDGIFAYLDLQMTATTTSSVFRVLSEITLDLRTPKTVLVPFGTSAANDLSSTIGSATVRVGVDLVSLGVVAGDTFEILEGEDEGIYLVTGFDETYGGFRPILSEEMGATNSDIQYRVYRSVDGLQFPLVRVRPGGVKILDASGQDTGYKVPYALPIGARSLGAFSGSSEVGDGKNGFILPNPGTSWAPTADFVHDPDDWTEYDYDEDAPINTCYGDECLDCDGYIAVITLLSEEDSEGNILYISSTLPDELKDFLSGIKTWLLGLIESLEIGAPGEDGMDDLESAIRTFTPVAFTDLEGGLPEAGVVTIAAQFEICIPKEMFDGCNNIFVAIPDFDWQSEFDAYGGFSEALEALRSGNMTGDAPILGDALAGDILTVRTGPNSGSYRISSIHNYMLCHAAAVPLIPDLSTCYQVTVAAIENEFPVPPMANFGSFFVDEFPTVDTFPTMSFPGTSYDGSGAIQSPWQWIQIFFDWLFQWMYSLGFDLPNGIELDASEALKAFWQMLFCEYTVSRPTCLQTVRAYFIEPTSFTARGSLPCEGYVWAPGEGADLVLTSEFFSLPLPGLSGLTAAIEIFRDGATVDLSGELGEDFDTYTTIDEIVDGLQALLDADADYVTVGYNTDDGYADAWRLTLTFSDADSETAVYVAADSAEDAFRWFGFRSTSGGEWATGDFGEGATTPFYTQLAAGEWGFKMTMETSFTRITGLSISAESFQVGEPVTQVDNEDATGVVFAWGEDAVDGHYILLWAVDPAHPFISMGSAVTGLLSSAVLGSGLVCTTNFTIEADAIHTFGADTPFPDVGADLATELETKFWEAVDNGQADDDFGHSAVGFTVEFVDSGDEEWVFRVTVTNDPETGGVLPEFTLSAGAADNDLVAAYFTTTESTDLTVDSDEIALIESEFAATFSDGTAILTALTYAEAVALDDTLAHIDAGEYSEAAADLNALASSVSDSTSGARVLQWVGSDSGEGDFLLFRTMEGGAEFSVELTDGFDNLDFTLTTYTGSDPDSNCEAVGETAVGTSVADVYSPPSPTLLAVAASSAEVLFCATGDEDPQQVFPPPDESGPIGITSLPRDMGVGSSYTGCLSAKVWFDTDDYEAPILAGITPGSDYLYVYEQRAILEQDAALPTHASRKDRLVCVITAIGSNAITLPAFTGEVPSFTAPESGDTADQVVVGDYVFVEEGEDIGGYKVVTRAARSLSLDARLTENTATLLKYGLDGNVTAGSSDFFVDAGQFNTADVGKWLTIWGSDYDNVIGSFQITARSSSTTVTLDTDVFEYTEESLHWAVVDAPDEDPGESAVGGRTALIGVRPIRIYNGTPAQFRVASVSPSLTRTEAPIHVVATESEYPRVGVKQPYQFVRPGSQRISAGQMLQQGTVHGGLYYFDFKVFGLGGGDNYNIAEKVRMEPVFGTYDSDGYYLEVTDSNLVYSPQEELQMIISPSVIPTAFEDTASNSVMLGGRGLAVSYDYASTVDSIQQLLTSDNDRVLCANPLARHFLPSYFYFAASYTGGSDSVDIIDDIQDYVNGKEPTGVLDISDIEKIFHNHEVTRYAHPMEFVVVTHDLDRRIVGSWTENRLSGTDVDFNGSNRTSYFIAGDNADEVDEDGEKISLTRGSSSATF